MSSDEEFLAALVSSYDAVLTDTFVGFAAIAFFTYDFAITFDREVRFFWRRRPSLVLMVFLSISCTVFINAESIARILINIPVAVFSAMRAYALCKSRIISGLILFLALAPFFVNTVVYATSNKPAVDDFGLLKCGFAASRALRIVLNPSLTRSAVAVTSRTPVILADALIALVTWHTLSRDAASLHIGQRSRTTFSSVLLWNGMSYFILLTVLNILHLTFTLTSMFTSGSFGPSNVTTFTDPLTAVLTYRFIIDLHAANAGTVKMLRVDGARDRDRDEDPLHGFSMGSQRPLSFACTGSGVGCGPGLKLGLKDVDGGGGGSGDREKREACYRYDGDSGELSESDATSLTPTLA